MMITSCVVELAEATCARVPHHIYTHPLRRSGLLPFFSPPVIQEWLINFAGERQRSRMTSHCEIILGFCLSASHPVVELRITGLTSTSRSSRTTCSKSLALLRSSNSVLSVRRRILCSWVRNRRNGVRFPKRPHDSFRVPSGVPVQRSISERDCSHPVKLSSEKQRLKPFEVSPHDLCQVPCVTPVQWFSPERSPSYPV